MDELEQATEQKPKRKSNAAEVQQRVEQVLPLMLDGKTFAEIVQFAADSGWNVGERQLRNYVFKANCVLSATLETNRRILLARHIAMREVLYGRAVEEKDIRAALAVLDSLAKVQGLDEHVFNSLRVRAERV